MLDSCGGKALQSTLARLIHTLMFHFLVENFVVWLEFMMTSFKISVVIMKYQKTLSLDYSAYWNYVLDIYFVPMENNNQFCTKFPENTLVNPQEIFQNCNNWKQSVFSKLFIWGREFAMLHTDINAENTFFWFYYSPRSNLFCCADYFSSKKLDICLTYLISFWWEGEQWEEVMLEILCLTVPERPSSIFQLSSSQRPQLRFRMITPF